jgi:hypothetical protein
MIFMKKPFRSGTPSPKGGEALGIAPEAFPTFGGEPSIVVNPLDSIA